MIEYPKQIRQITDLLPVNSYQVYESDAGWMVKTRRYTVVWKKNSEKLSILFAYDGLECISLKEAKRRISEASA